MKKLGIMILAAAIVAPATGAFAGGSNPMSQGYNARSKGHQETTKQARRMEQKGTKQGAQKRQ